MKQTINLQERADRQIIANRQQTAIHSVVIVAVCLCATVAVGLTGIGV